MTSSASPLTTRPPAKLGRPPLDASRGVMVRVREPLCSALDEWRAQHIERPLSRPEALRRLAALALAAAAEKEPFREWAKRSSARAGACSRQTDAAGPWRDEAAAEALSRQKTQLSD